MKSLVIILLAFFCFPGFSQAECVRGDCINGEGRLIHKGGIVYEGRFKEGKFHGEGVLVFPNGDKMTGYFQDHFLNEQGVLLPKYDSLRLHFVRAAGDSYFNRFEEYVKKTMIGKIILISLCTGVIILVLILFTRPFEKMIKALRPPKSADQKHKDEILSRVLKEMKDRGKIDPKNSEIYASLIGAAEENEPGKIWIETDNNHQMSIYEAYDILGVAEGAKEEEIKAAFRERIKKFHPDRLTHLDDDFKKLARQKTQRLNAAYQLLKEHKPGF